MDYNNKLLALADKHKQFFADKQPGQILAIIPPYTFDIDYSAFGLPGRPLDSWDFNDIRSFVEYEVKRQRAYDEYVKDLDNDYIPTLNLNFGYGVHSAYFTGAEVIMGKETSWTKPWLADWDMLDDLHHDENNLWFQRIMEGYRYLKEFQDGDYTISGLANAGPGDMANAIRGDELFLDLYDEDAPVHRLMDLCADAAIWLEESIHKIIGPQLKGGAVTANCWFPGYCPYISEDFSDLCSAELYEKFGRKHTQKIIDHFGGGYIHHHAKGAHVHQAMASLPGLSLLEQSWDPNCSRPIDRLPELIQMHNKCGLPLMTRCTADDVYTYIDELMQGRVVLMLNIDNLEQGHEVMKFIRSHSKI